MVQTLYLVRHAAPDRSLAMPYNQLPGPPLTTDGHREAQAAAEFLATQSLQALLVSPFARALETAAPIAAATGLPAIVAEQIREMGPGESHPQVRQRMRTLLAELDTGPYTTLALIAHGAPIHHLLLEMTADRIDLTPKYDHGNTTPAAGIWRCVRYDGYWRCELVFQPASAPAAAPALEVL